ncbi:unnamed protein product [Schistosoma turkestanicum]|nr:unnamed protein product [Schistosoma turkestanicum]
MYFCSVILKLTLLAVYFNYLVAYRIIGSEEELKHDSEDAITALCQDIVRNTLANTIDYHTDDPYIEVLTEIWRRKCIPSRSKSPRSIKKRPYYG